jgi:hypothetical protein
VNVERMWNELTTKAAEDYAWDLAHPDFLTVTHPPTLKAPELPAWAWPGGYTIVYYTRDGSELCAECATGIMAEVQSASTFVPPPDETDKPIDCDTYDEGPVIFCAECNKEMASSYGDPDDPDAAGSVGRGRDD